MGRILSTCSWEEKDWACTNCWTNPKYENVWPNLLPYTFKISLQNKLIDRNTN